MNQRRPVSLVIVLATAMAMTVAACTSGGGGTGDAFAPKRPTTTTESLLSLDDVAGSVGETNGDTKAGVRIPVSEDPSELDNQWNDLADRVGPDPEPDAAGADACMASVPVPLADRELVGDPVADLASATMPSVYGSTAPLDEVIEFETLAEYRDPSTPTDLDALLTAWTEAGFAGGVAAKRQVGNNIVMATAVEFRSPEDAKAAVTAHLRDLCHRAEASQAQPDGAGMMMLRESGAVRTVWAVERYELSLFICVCVGNNNTERQDAMVTWHQLLDQKWSKPGDGTTNAADPSVT